MSFDIFFQPCRLGNEPVPKKNPFTGEVQSVLPAEPLTADEVQAVRDVLAAFEARGPDEQGCYVVTFGDGGRAEFFGDDLSMGCMVAVRSLTPDLLRFLYDLLRAADWVLLPAMEGNPAIVSAPGRASGFAGRFPEDVCGSFEELGSMLGDEYESWRQYRDRVVGEGE